jgi:hypothetical protein
LYDMAHSADRSFGLRQNQAIGTDGRSSLGPRGARAEPELGDWSPGVS